MSEIVCRLRRALALACAALLTLSCSQAQAWTAASDWVVGTNTRARLLAASDIKGGEPGSILAGVQIELSPEWKTYWRSPGDSGGIPPELQWDKSENLKSATVEFPAPHRIPDALGDSVGYKEAVTLPVEVSPAEPGKPVKLQLDLLYGVCKNICIPAEMTLGLELSLGGSDEASIRELLEAAEARVPRDRGDASSPQVVAVSLEPQASPSALVVDARFPPEAKDVDLFVEAVDGSYLPLPDKASADGSGLARFRIDLTKADAVKSWAGKQLRLTLVSDTALAEVQRQLP